MRHGSPASLPASLLHLFCLTEQKEKSDSFPVLWRARLCGSWNSRRQHPSLFGALQVGGRRVREGLRRLLQISKGRGSQVPSTTQQSCCTVACQALSFLCPKSRLSAAANIRSFLPRFVLPDSLEIPPGRSSSQGSGKGFPESTERPSTPATNGLKGLTNVPAAVRAAA